MKNNIKLIIVLLCLNSCIRESKKEIINNTDEFLIEKPGLYKFNSSTFDISLKDNMIYYLLTDSNNVIKIDKNHFSNLHNWAIYKDIDNTIWVYSSDIGFYKWEKHDNKYLKKKVPLNTGIPKPIYNKISSVLKNKFTPAPQDMQSP